MYFRLFLIFQLVMFLFAGNIYSMQSKHAYACAECHRAHKRCSPHRPCTSCMKSGVLCESRKRKKYTYTRESESLHVPMKSRKAETSNNIATTTAQAPAIATPQQDIQPSETTTANSLPIESDSSSPPFLENIDVVPPWTASELELLRVLCQPYHVPIASAEALFPQDRAQPPVIEQHPNYPSHCEQSLGSDSFFDGFIKPDDDEEY